MPPTRTPALNLDNVNRQRIYDQLSEKPGMNRNQLRKELDLALGVLNYHLGKLEEAGLVVRKPSTNDKEILLFTNDNQLLWNDPDTRLLFGSHPTRSVALYIAENPGTRTREIAKALDIKPVTVRYHLSKLRDHDLTYRVPAGRKIKYEPSSKLEEWVSERGDSYQRPGE